MAIRPVLFCTTLALTVPLTSVWAPVLAAEDTLQQREGGKSLMQQGADLFLRGLTEQMEPALEDLRDLTEELGPQILGFWSEMGPALSDLAEQVEDWSVYEAPEILENGDIIIRRKPDQAPDGFSDDLPNEAPGNADDADGPIEL